jgi:hypothetical protein
MGILLIPKAVPQAKPLGHSTATANWFRGTQPVQVRMPDPASPTYGREMDRFSNARRYVSPLGGLSGPEWSSEPKWKSRPVPKWRGSVPGQRDPGDMSQYQHQLYPGRK